MASDPFYVPRYVSIYYTTPIEQVIAQKEELLEAMWKLNGYIAMHGEPPLIGSTVVPNIDVFMRRGVTARQVQNFTAHAMMWEMYDEMRIVPCNYEKNLWLGENGELNIRFLHHMIKRFSADVGV